MEYTENCPVLSVLHKGQKKSVCVSGILTIVLVKVNNSKTRINVFSTSNAVWENVIIVFVATSYSGENVLQIVYFRNSEGKFFLGVVSL